MGRKLKERRYVCTHNWVTLLYSRNAHNTVKQLYSNKNLKTIKENKKGIEPVMQLA